MFQDIYPNVCTYVGVFLSYENEIKLRHYKLRHLSFPYLKVLYQTLYKDKKVVDFQCEICELSKHHHAYFPSQIYK